MTPKVSVLLPVYNGAHTIQEAVTSILNQTFTEFELLLINDGSTDSTIRELHDFDDPRLKIHSIQQNGGIARALNFGLELSAAPIIARMDADDYCHPERLEKQYQHLKQHPNCDVVSCLVEQRGNEEQLGYAYHVEEINSIISSNDIYNKRFQESPIAHPSVMFRKRLIEQFGGYNESELPEDYELWLRWMYHGVMFHKVNDNLLIWNDLPTRISRNYKAYSDQNFYKLKAKYLAKHFRKVFNELPTLWIWGTGRQVNKNNQSLLHEGFTIAKFIDVKKSTSTNTVYYKDLPPPGDQVILSLVRDRKGKQEILRFMIDRGYIEGKDFFMLS